MARVLCTVAAAALAASALGLCPWRALTVGAVVLLCMLVAGYGDTLD